MNALSAMLTKTLGAGGPGDIWIQRGLRLALPLLAALLMLAALAGQVSAQNDEREPDGVQSGSLLVQGKEGEQSLMARRGVVLAAGTFSTGTGCTTVDMGHAAPYPCPTHPCGAALFALRGSPVVSKDRGQARACAKWARTCLMAATPACPSRRSK